MPNRHVPVGVQSVACRVAQATHCHARAQVKRDAVHKVEVDVQRVETLRPPNPCNPSDRWFSPFVCAIRPAPKAQYSIPSPCHPRDPWFNHKKNTTCWDASDTDGKPEGRASLRERVKRLYTTDDGFFLKKNSRPPLCLIL